MVLEKKSIGVFFLWIAGLVILGHELVPHHHHYHSAYPSSPYSVENEFCEHSHEHDEPSDNSEKHCHAFNDITVERQNIKILTPKAFSDQGLFLLPVFISGRFHKLEFQSYALFLPEISDPGIFILSNSPHRGPPVA